MEARVYKTGAEKKRREREKEGKRRRGREGGEKKREKEGEREKKHILDMQFCIHTRTQILKRKKHKKRSHSLMKSLE